MGKIKVIIELEDDVYRRVKNNPQIFKNATCVAVQNGIALPDNATNGQVLLQIFPPSVYYGDDEKHIVLLTKDCELTCYNNEWWNAPYKAESED